MAAPDKVDFKRALRSLYGPSRGLGVHPVTVPDMRFLMIDGMGDPNAPAYADAVGALYGVAYPLKFASKQTLGRDYVVPPLEALWDAHDMDSYGRGDRDAWRWTAMLMVPDWLNEEMVAAALSKARTKDVARAGEVRLETLCEGDAVQALHVGPYSAEAPLIAAIHEEITRMGRRLAGRHHEIYLTDPRKAAPDRMRTVLRQPTA